MVEGNALELVFTYLDSNVTSDVRLIFEGLRVRAERLICGSVPSTCIYLMNCLFQFLTSLLCHKRISAQFIQSNGIQCMLTVPRPSMASTAVAVNLYYMAYFEDAMELVRDLSCLQTASVLNYHLFLFRSAACRW